MNKTTIYDIKLTNKQLEEVLGVSHMTLYRWRKDGLPFEKDGGLLVYNLGDVERWLDKQGATNKISFR